MMAHWQYEVDDGFMGFSPTVSSSLESAYLQWANDPQGGDRHPAKVRSGHFLYIIDFYSATEVHGEARSMKRLRRISVVEAETAQMCTVEKSLWKELETLRVETEGLRAEAERRAAAFSNSEEEVQCRAAEELQAELGRLRAACEERTREAALLNRELQDERRLNQHIEQCLSAPFPGRLVSVTADHASLASATAVPVGSVGRVRVLEGAAASVDFAELGRYGVWLPCQHLQPAREAELLSRPGTRVAWVAEDGLHAYGVVCGPLDDIMVSVLGSDGRKLARNLRFMSLDEHGRDPCEPLEVGDLVRLGGGAGSERVGMVVRATEDGLCVRFHEESGEGETHRDVTLEPAEAEAALLRDGEADRVRPGSGVRLRSGALPAQRVEGQSAVGLVYAVHADGTAIVDFAGNMGCRCGVEWLEVVDHPPATDHSLLRMLSECLSWHEISLQRWEERRDEILMRLLEALPVAPPASSAEAEALELVHWGPQTELFHFVAKLLPGSVRGHVGPWPNGRGSGRAHVPQLCVERVEQVSNLDLRRLYALRLQRFLASRRCAPEGIAEEVEEDSEDACDMPPGPSAHERYLWCSVPLEAADRVCRVGFEGASLRFSACASAAALDAGGAVGGARCLILARAFLDRGTAAEGDRGRCEHAARDAPQALPLLRVHYHHLPACACPVCLRGPMAPDA